MVRLRVLIALARPAVVILFALVVGVGITQGGGAERPLPMLAALVPVISFLLFAVAINDIADEQIDRVNLAGNRGRPLVTGLASNRDMHIVAATAAVTSVASSVLLGWVGVAVIAAGLLFAAAYSLAPIRLASRGFVASLTLPFGYVAVPFAVGVVAARGRLEARDLVLLSGIYLAFIGRLVLKDFRDVRGDALFGKRTFLVRRGRRAACAVAAVFWTVGTAVIAVATGFASMGAPVYVAYAAVTLALLVALARSTSARRDEWLISAAAIIGRGTLVSVIAQLSLATLGKSTLVSALVLIGIAVATIGSAQHMARRGPTAHRYVPDELLEGVDEADATSETSETTSRPTTTRTPITVADPAERVDVPAHG